MNKLSVLMQSELNQVSQRLTFRIQELAERYETPYQNLLKKLIILKLKSKDILRKWVLHGFKSRLFANRGWLNS